jgi:copper resistance protein C
VTVLRGALSVLLALFAVLLTAGPAMAQTALTGSDPAEGASLSSAPEKVTLTFEEAVTVPPDPINVTGPDGSSWIVGTTTVTGASVTAPVQGVGPSGPCILNYTVIADDGDEVKGSVRFTLTTGTGATTTTGEAAPATVSAATATATAAAEPAPTAADGESSSTSGWVWVAIVVIVIGVLAGIGVIRTRRGAGRE